MNYKDGLETERLTTRFLTANDATVWTAFFEDTLAPKFLPNVNGLSPAERSVEWMSFQLKRYAENRLGMQALIDKKSGAFVGMCGLLLQEVTSAGGENPRTEVEVGYHLLPRFWGNGYATEAARAFRDYAFKNEFATSIISIIHPDNILSQNVATRNGMQLSEKGIMLWGKPYDEYRIMWEEWTLL